MREKLIGDNDLMFTDSIQGFLNTELRVNFKNKNPKVKSRKFYNHSYNALNE